MGLPLRQRMELEYMDRTLRGTDPRLAALYAIFGRLTREEEMPRIEQLRPGMLARTAWLLLVLAAVAARLHIWLRSLPPGRTTRRTARDRRRIGLGPRQRMALFYPLAIALAVGSIVLAARSGPSRSCLPTRATAAARNFARSSLCRPASYSTPLIYGH